jgi:hypothetical protein
MADLTITETILKELSGLPEDQQADVLAFVRFLKIGLGDVETTDLQFEIALDRARKIAESQKISDEDIEEEIRAYRTKK